jgi:hypothetical protein
MCSCASTQERCKRRLDMILPPFQAAAFIFPGGRLLRTQLSLYDRPPPDSSPDSDDGWAGTRGSQSAPTHRAAWPYSRARGSAAAAASPRGPSDPPRGGSRSRRRLRGRARCSGRRGGEGSGGGVGRRARAPQRGRRVALPAPRQPLRGRRQSQTDVRGHGTGARQWRLRRRPMCSAL